MQKFKSHKVVEAAKIDRIERGTGSSMLHFEGVTRYQVSEQWIDKHTPSAGGYFVRYPDGYESFSPAQAFEEGYTAVDANTPIGREVCPDCFRFKARNADDCAAGDCSKWHAVRDSDAEADCTHFRDKTGYFMSVKPPTPTAGAYPTPEETLTTGQPKITGYRNLTVDEIGLMNKIKARGADIEALLLLVREHVAQQRACADDIDAARIAACEPERWVAMARTDFQTALMKLTRAVAQPTTF